MQSSKFVLSLVAFALAAAMTAQAQAVTVTRADGQPMNPNGEPFSAAGATTYLKGSIVINCTTRINGTVTPTGIVWITSASLTGAPLCQLAQPSASSASMWTGQIETSTQLSINNMAINWNLFGPCGPNQVTTAWSNALPWADNPSGLTFSSALLTPNCTISGSLVTSPKLRVD
ncbi:hypothetical protein Bsp3421_006769 [Burkholderia sp. FERM BP-3421]|jgi:hypothetical protein|uniref:hypothetical protein n=1 Tax=Burkholderia sp. FERM BP-3421 TaxID=1494466 RepID=UPI0023612E3F|nr:hypothetical protein [Burkholderia sp. FERM BP-3421]WDD96554.1 hypothetical protein Bsp3421_006769 [Burkholderia sp. FERM BP-3421]